MVKRKYMKPAMRMVEIQLRHFLLTSPGGREGMKISIQRGSTDDVILNDDVEDII